MAVFCSANPVHYFLKSFEKQQLEIKYAQLEKQTNIKHREVNFTYAQKGVDHI